MAFATNPPALPSTFIAGLSVVEAGGAVPASPTGMWLLIPLSSVPELDPDGSECAAVANPTSTPDIRKVALALEDMLFNVYNGMDMADRPANWRHVRSTNPDDAAGTSTRSYYATFTTTFPSVEVADEPEPEPEPEA